MTDHCYWRYATIQNSRPSFGCAVLWVVQASLVIIFLILVPVCLFYYRDYISAEATAGAASFMFVMAVIYGYLLLFHYLLLSLIKRSVGGVDHKTPLAGLYRVEPG